MGSECIHHPNTYTNPEDPHRRQWLEERRAGIGGSDCAAILGLSRWRSPLQVFLEKTGQVPDQETTETMHLGNLAEEPIAREFARREDLKIERCNRIVRHPAAPIVAANIDRRIVGTDHDGKKAGLEVKKVTAFMYHDWLKNGPPADVVFQCHHYLLATGWDRWYIAAQFGHAQEHWHIDRDEDLLQDIMERELLWWDQHVMRGEAPEVDGSKSCAELLIGEHPSSNGESAVLDTEGETVARQYLEAKRELKERELDVERMKQRLQQMLGDFERAENDRFRVKWASTKARETLDTKALKAAHPEIDYASFTKVGKPSRRFSIDTFEQEDI